MHVVYTKGDIPSLVCKIRSSLARVAFAFRATQFPASQVEEKEVLAYMVFLEVVVGLLLPPGSQVKCCIVNLPVLDAKSEKMLAYTILVQERTTEFHSLLLSEEYRGRQLKEIPAISNFG